MLRNWTRKLNFESLTARICFAFGDVDLNFAGDGRFEDSFEVANRPDLVVEILDGSDNSQIIFENIQSGSGHALRISKLDAAGQPDEEFGVNGYLEWFDRDHAESVVDAFRLSNENIVVRASSIHSNNSLIAFDSQGNLDTDFADRGILRLGNSFIWGTIAHPAGGFIVVETDDFESFLTRFTNDGRIDGSFGQEGQVRLPKISQPQIIHDAEGRLLLFGSRGGPYDAERVLVRCLADGSRDETFAPNGVRIAKTPTHQRMHMAPAGDAYFTVATMNGADNRTYIIEKYTLELQLDPSFGVNGSTQFEVPMGLYATSLRVLPSSAGGLVIQETWHEHHGSRIDIASITAEGHLDPSFGDQGIAQHRSSLDTIAYDFERDQAGNLYWGGSYSIHGTSAIDSLIFRFNPAGKLDESWGDSGRRIVSRTVGTQQIDFIDLAATHRGTPLIQTGWHGPSSAAYGTGRLHATNASGTLVVAALDSISGLRPVAIGDGSGGWYSINAQAREPYFIELRRFDANGMLDTTFGEKGLLAIRTTYPHKIVARLDDKGSLTIVVSDYQRTADQAEGVGAAVIIRLTAAGALDQRFAQAGVLRLYEKPHGIPDVMVSSKLGIVLAYGNSTLQAFSPRGEPIPSFGTNGIAKPTGVYERSWVTGEIDEMGNVLGVIRGSYTYDTHDFIYKLVKISGQGVLDTTFADTGIISLPWEWNTGHDAAHLAVQSGKIVLANAHGRHASSVRFLAYDYSGESLTDFGDNGVRDYRFAENGHTVSGLEFADDGSIWLSLKERHGFDELGAVYRIVGSARGQQHNWYQPLDVNRDDLITPLDALMIVNRLNSGGEDQLDKPDVSNDDLISPLDVLLVINHLNLQPPGSGEGESMQDVLSYDMSWLWEDEEKRRVWNR